VAGFGHGGALAMDLARWRPDDVRACVTFYGVAPGRDWSALRAPVQGHFPQEDGEPPSAQVHDFERALVGLGREVQVHVYAARPGFFDDTRADVFEPESARTAWIRTLDFLRSKLG
jgi:carboxymethylenebutenolidase